MAAPQGSGKSEIQSSKCLPVSFHKIESQVNHPDKLRWMIDLQFNYQLVDFCQDSSLTHHASFVTKLSSPFSASVLLPAIHILIAVPHCSVAACNLISIYSFTQLLIINSKISFLGLKNEVHTHEYNIAQFSVCCANDRSCLVLDEDCYS